MLEAILVSPVHAYEGRPTDPPGPPPTPLDQVEVHADLGLLGDRYYNHPAHRTAAVTLLSLDALDEVARALATPLDPFRTRRNLLLRGFPVDTLAATRTTPGALFTLDTGTGPLRFRAHRPASPCRWMDTQLADGAFRALRGRAGVRCTPLDSGTLSTGPATLEVLT
ncbi:MOSC domain-containing protein [Actinokineospora bangkokensis]|uniref:MOSC domain-containing protein n=1 Tax=Actinokineospora bangkokensis TaxID=1193682 RepID=UPI000A3E21E5|nr:MOSC domain-containing protein [Actinokineospora bangkokensis]